MDSQFTTSITYFLREGRENLRECLRVAFSAAKNHNIATIIVFTAEGLGIRLVLDEFEEELTEYRRLVAVTFPVGKPFTNAAGEHLKVEIPTTLREEMRQRGIPVVRAHLPFDPISGTYPSRGVLGQDLNLVANALNMFGGSMSLCVQAIVMACDAGEVQPGDHVIALTSDTAILAQAAPTANMLKGLAIREVLCKPAIYTIGRNESVDQLAMPLEVAEQPRPLSSSSEGKILPPAGLDPTK